MALVQEGPKGSSALIAKTEDFFSDRSTEAGSDGSDCEGSGDDGGDAGALAHFSPEETLVILDWDDTLLPTSWIEAQGLRLACDSEPSPEQRALLELMAQWASRTLHKAKTYGSVIIVTNAEHGWIELSCEKFMPALLHELEGVKILSARSRYERQGVAQPSDWKLLAFRGEIELFFLSLGDLGRRKNIVSVGDSSHEREALIRVTDCVPNSCAKALKLMERPGAEEFLKEHEILCSCLGDIVNYEGSLDVSIRSPRAE